jgi:hypothetical protein
LPSNAIVRRRLPGRLLLGDRNRPPQHRSAPSRTIPLSPRQSCRERRPDSQSDRPGWRHRVIACRRKRSCHAPRGAAENTRQQQRPRSNRCVCRWSGSPTSASVEQHGQPGASACWRHAPLASAKTLPLSIGGERWSPARRLRTCPIARDPAATGSLLRLGERSRRAFAGLAKCPRSEPIVSKRSENLPRPSPALAGSHRSS